MSDRKMIEELMEKYRRKATALLEHAAPLTLTPENVERIARELAEADIDGQQKAAYRAAVVTHALLGGQ